MPRLTPLHDRVAVTITRPTMTPGGLHIPDKSKSGGRTHEEGIVVAVGPGRRKVQKLIAGELSIEQYSDERIPIDVKVGDRVIFGKHAGTECELGGEKVLLLDEGELLATLSEVVS